MGLSADCMDPKKLLEKAFLKPDQFITGIQISTFKGEDIVLDWSTNLSIPMFKIVDFVFDHLTFEKDDPKITSCYELVIPEILLKDGIQSIFITLNLLNWNALDTSFIKISPPGYFHQNSDVKRRDIENSIERSSDLVYQIDNFLKIGDEDCNPDPSYNRDECVIDQLLNVRKYQFDDYSNPDLFKIHTFKKYLDTYTFSKKYLDTDTFKILSEKSI